MRETRPAPIRRINDPTLEKGTELVVEEGSPARSTTVTRKVYSADGALLYDETWNTNYRGEYREIHVGTKPKPKPKPEPKPAPPPAPKTTTGTTTTEPPPTTTTAPAVTTTTTPQP